MVDINLTGVKDIMDLNSSLSVMPPELASKFSSLLTLLKAAGIIFIIYILFLIVKSILGIRRNRKIDKMYNKINEIDEKLDSLIRKFKPDIKEETPVKSDKIKLKPKNRNYFI